MLAQSCTGVGLHTQLDGALGMNSGRMQDGSGTHCGTTNGGCAFGEKITALLAGVLASVICHRRAPVGGGGSMV
jgi:hypothetical protein